MDYWTRRQFVMRSLLGAAVPAAFVVNSEENADAQQIAPAELQAMEDVALAFMKQYDVPGFSVAITKDGRLVYRRGFGFADRRNREKVTPESLFRIASVTKPFTSTTIFRLIEAGRLELQDKIFGQQGLLQFDFGGPPFKKWVEDITLEHLLTHTCGGWPNDGTDPMFHNPQMNHKELITWAIQAIPLTHAPGTNYAYSNFGYCILGRVIEKIIQRPYSEAVQEQVLGRCGITSMRIAGNTLEERAHNEVVYYGQGGENPYGMQVSRMDSHGGWLATPTDLVRFLVRVDGFPTNPDILKADIERVMWTPSTANSGYAKGWIVNRANNYWHNGSLPGTTTIMVRTSGGFCWGALTNTRQPNSNIGGDLDRLIWNMVGKVSVWPSYDLFNEPRRHDP